MCAGCRPRGLGQGSRVFGLLNRVCGKPRQQKTETETESQEDHLEGRGLGGTAEGPLPVGSLQADFERH